MIKQATFEDVLRYGWGGKEFPAYDGQACMYGPAGGAKFTGFGAIFYGGESIGPPVSTGASFAGVLNVIYVCVLNLKADYTVAAIATRAQAGTGAGGFATCAIYSFDGTTRQVYAGDNAFSINGSGNFRTVLSSTVVLKAGLYIFAFSATVAGGVSGQGHVASTGLFSQVLNQGGKVYFGTVSQTLSAGAMPASIDAPASWISDTSHDIPGWAFLT